MKTPLVIFSFDGLSKEDLAYLKSKPNFSRFLNEASGSDQVKTIYPSVTYAAHASILTGCLPKRHGIVDNTKLQPGRMFEPDWYWYKKAIRCKTLIDAAKEEGYTVAALLWPTTGRAKINYNMPEIFNNRPWISQLMVSMYAGTIGYQYKMVKRHDHLRKGKSQPALDNFVTAATLDTIKDHQPDMLLVHLTDLDSMRHENGHYSQAAYQALDRHDDRLGLFLDALATVEKYNHAYVVALGDHSSIDVTHGISLNKALMEWGMLQKTPTGYTGVKAIAKSCDGSAYIYLVDKAIEADLLQNLKTLCHLHQDKVHLVDHKTLIDMGADPSAFAMLEATPPYHFTDEATLNLIHPIEEINYYKGRPGTAVHGFSPDKANYTTCFYIKGPNIHAGQPISDFSLIDIAPTLAQLLNFDMPDTDGQSHYQTLTGGNA